MEKKFDVKGMTCASCQAHVQKAVESLDGVNKVNVNLLTNSMDVDFTCSIEDIEKAVKDAGYEASLPNETKNNKAEVKDYGLVKLIISLVLLIILMYISMAHMVNIPLPSFLDGLENSLINAFSQFLISLIVIFLYKDYFTNGFKRLFKLSPNMDSLIALGASASFLYGIVSIYFIGYGLGHNNLDIVTSYYHNLYFDSVVMILALVSLGKYLENLSKKRTTKAIEKLIALAPQEARLLKDGQETIVNVNQVKVNDIFIVKKGDNVPLDGVIVEGKGSLNQANITGESLPVLKGVGDEIFSSTILTSGYLKVKATKVGEDTSINQIIKLVEEASNSKAPISKLVDKISFFFVPTILLIALISFIAFLIAYDFELSFNMGISVLVIACPCALGLATPVAIMVSSGKGAENGLLIKNAEILEKAHNIKTIVFDKTGTITEGNPRVVDIIDYTQDNLLMKIAYSLELQSEHPLSQSIVNYAKEKSLDYFKVERFNSLDGLGIKGDIDGESYYGGNYKLIVELGLQNDDVEELLRNFSNQGKTPLIFASNKKILGVVAIKDEIKKHSKRAIQELNKMGIKTIMLTGDNLETAKVIAEEVGIKEYIANVLPLDKQNVINSLKSDSHHLVAMVGDGVNDSLALANADLSISLGHGSDIAIETSDIVLLRDDLLDVKNVIKLSKRTINTIKFGLFWAFFYNCIGVILASGVFYPSFGIRLNPMIGSLCMSFSSVFVVLNALTINFFKVDKDDKSQNIDKPIKRKEVKKMEKITLHVEGMMCMHCVKHVEDALKKVDGVKKVDVSLDKKEAIIEGENLNKEELIKAIVASGYQAS